MQGTDQSAAWQDILAQVRNGALIYNGVADRLYINW